jgi:hypothetical protein
LFFEFSKPFAFLKRVLVEPPKVNPNVFVL